jgi:misacylated tRNA(Ala) deacylase
MHLHSGNIWMMSAGLSYIRTERKTMTELLYQTDSYLKEFDATVVMVDEENHGVILDRSAFYPGGGGQPADRGVLYIGEAYDNTAFDTRPRLEVKRAKKVGDDVVHLITGDDLLPRPGSKVHGEIDWSRRYKLMRTHTAMHILCGVIFRDYGASVTGGDMEPLKGRMDFEFETMHKELVEKIEQAINQEVENAHPVKTDILPREEAFQIPDLIRTKINLLPESIQQVRVVEIEGLDLQADGGTHVNNTSEVGIIHVADYKSKGKINKRIYVQLDE